MRQALTIGRPRAAMPDIEIDDVDAAPLLTLAQLFEQARGVRAGNVVTSTKRRGV